MGVRSNIFYILSIKIDLISLTVSSKISFSISFIISSGGYLRSSSSLISSSEIEIATLQISFTSCNVAIIVLQRFENKNRIVDVWKEECI